jgi:hypothetical protein
MASFARNAAKSLTGPLGEKVGGFATAAYDAYGGRPQQEDQSDGDAGKAQAAPVEQEPSKWDFLRYMQLAAVILTIIALGLWIAARTQPIVTVTIEGGFDVSEFTDAAKDTFNDAKDTITGIFDKRDELEGRDLSFKSDPLHIYPITTVDCDSFKEKFGDGPGTGLCLLINIAINLSPPLLMMLAWYVTGAVLMAFNLLFMIWDLMFMNVDNCCFNAIAFCLGCLMKPLSVLLLVIRVFGAAAAVLLTATVDNLIRMGFQGEHELKKAGFSAKSTGVVGAGSYVTGAAA